VTDRVRFHVEIELSVGDPRRDPEILCNALRTAVLAHGERPTIIVRAELPRQPRRKGAEKGHEGDEE
jgi:hypothetical protein